MRADRKLMGSNCGFLLRYRENLPLKLIWFSIINWPPRTDGLGLGTDFLEAKGFSPLCFSLFSLHPQASVRGVPGPKEEKTAVRF